MAVRRRGDGGDLQRLAGLVGRPGEVVVEHDRRVGIALGSITPTANSSAFPAGGSLTSVTVMTTVAVCDSAWPSLALNVNESVPKKSALGV